MLRLQHHLARHWHHHLLGALALLVAFSLLAGGAAKLHVCGVQVDAKGSKLVCGVKLTAKGQKALKVVAHGDELGQGAIVTEHPPTAAIARLNVLAAKQALVKYPTLAAPEPSFKSCPVRNFSTRHGPVLLFVVHDTESPNVSGRGPPGLQDVYAICTWFNNPNAQASSNYTTDADGNTLQMVSEADKAWTQAGFNSYAVSDELIGYASQTSWPFAQLLAAAKIAAHTLAVNHVPAIRGVVDGSTCRVLRPGIVMHLDLGQCGGGHHDAGTSFPLGRFIRLVASLQHPAKVIPRKVLRARARVSVLALRRSGSTWPQVKASAVWRRYVALGGS